MSLFLILALLSWQCLRVPYFDLFILSFWFIGFFPDKGKLDIEEYRCLSQKAKTEGVNLGAMIIPAIPYKV